MTKMIVWLNGAFGVGKTQTAYRLKRRLKEAFVYDPENLGCFIRENIPPGMEKPDFQEYPFWREGNAVMLKYIASHYDGVMIVPMTVTDHFYEITSCLEGIPFCHAVLWASAETIKKRLKTRGEGKRSWAYQQIERCVSGLTLFPDADKIQTDALTLEQVVEKVAEHAGLSLLPDPRGNLIRKIERLKGKIRDIR